MQIEKLIEVLEIAIAAEKTEPPTPKYTDFTETKSGLIVGRHWVCLMQAWEESGLPGWHYTVKTSKRLGDCSIIHENEIELLEQPELTSTFKRLTENPIPEHADYQAGYTVGLRNAQRSGPSDPQWEFAPNDVSGQWGLGHAQALSEEGV